MSRGVPGSTAPIHGEGDERKGNGFADQPVVVSCSEREGFLDRTGRDGAVLTSKQQELVLVHRNIAERIAHFVWRRSGLPARHLEELNSDALLFLCESVANYVEGAWSIERVLFFQIERRLWGKVKQWRRHVPTELSNWDIAAPYTDDVNVDRLLLALRQLTPKQRDTVESRYGLDRLPSQSQRETALQRGVPQASVCRTEKRALDAMRRYLEEP